jgi:trk/ktr system potassium uptake protein
MMVLSFAGFIFFGTLLLMLPAAAETTPIDMVDALFTATSAVCVTGLTVVDTGETFSLFGEIVIALLIQTGGLGIMTLSTFFLLLAGRRLGLTGQFLIQDTFTFSRERPPGSILKDVILFCIVAEGFGMVLLFFCFLPGNGAGQAFYLSFFHAISAFCNAGFSLFSDSFSGYRDNWGANLVICLLIIAGGLGFLVLSEIRRQIASPHRVWARFSLHSKIVITTTGALLVSGTLMIAFMEWDNTLAPLSLPHRFLASFFHSVNARTSGFNTLPVGHMANETFFVIIMLMYIGASPGSCGGGIKTTTFAALVVAGLSRLRGHDRPQMFKRSLPLASLGKAFSVVMISTLVICIGLMALLMTEIGDISHPESRGQFLELFFEIVSAFGTVGLSTGVTAGLSDAGKTIITIMMFVGRLGPLVIGIAVSRPITDRYHYAEESIMVG